MNIHNLTLLGTSHISPKSIKAIEKAFLSPPDIVCLELDKGRFNSLMHPKKQRIGFRELRKVGTKGFFFLLLGKWSEQAMGKIVGTKPGDEMLKAIELAKINKTKIALVDQRIDITLKKLSARISWKEKFRFVWDVISSPFKKRKLPFSLEDVPSEEVIAPILEEVKRNYPNVYSVLIAERNEIIAHKIAQIVESNPDAKILAVLGAGHIKTVEKILRNV